MADAEVREPDVLEAEIALLALRPVLVVDVGRRPLKPVLDLIEAGMRPDQALDDVARLRARVEDAKLEAGDERRLPFEQVGSPLRAWS